MSLGAVIGLPCFADEHGNPKFSAGARFAMCLQSLSPPMNYMTSTCPVVGERIDVARNQIVEKALRDGAEHILFLDTDVLFPPTAFMSLLMRQRNNPDHKIVSGVYWSKCNPSFPLIFHEAGRGSNLDWRVGDYIEAPYAIGMGLVLIHTDVFRAIQPPWYTINYGLNIDNESGSISASSMTEDLPFCERALEAGFKMWVDTGIQAGHYDSNSGVIFGLNDSMPQAQGRSPGSGTLYIGDIMAGGEPADILARNPLLKPTWVGTPDKVPTDKKYPRVCVKDANLPVSILKQSVQEWDRVTKPGGTIEVMHPDFEGIISRGGEVSVPAYGPKVIEDLLTGQGFVELARKQEGDYFTIKGIKPSCEIPLISVVILAHGLKEMTYQCIDSVRQSEHEDFEFEIILVDNGSDEPLSAMGDKLVRLESNLQFGLAAQKGIEAAHPESKYYLLLNNDTVCPDKTWMQNLLTRLRGNGYFSAVGPKQVTPTGVIYHAGIGFGTDRVPFHLFAGWAHDHPNVQTEQEVLALNFGCVLIRREVFEKYGFDDRYGGVGNYEDIDWCLTVRKNGGHLLYTPSSEIVHFGAQTQAADPEASHKSVAENREKFVEKWGEEDPALFGQEPNTVPADESDEAGDGLQEKGTTN